MMTEIIEFFNFSTVIIGFTIVVLGFIFNVYVPYAKKGSRRFFGIFFSLLIAYVASNLLSQFFYMLGEGYIQLSRLALFGESLFSSLLMPLIAIHILVCADVPYKRSPVLLAEFVVWVVYFIMLISTWFNKLFYYFSEENVYYRGPLYPVLLIPPVLIMIINIGIYIRYFKKLTHNQRIAFAIYILLPTTAMLIQMFFYGIYLIVIATCIAAAFMFMFLMLEQIRLHIEQKELATRIYAENLALQMRPHFIYNVMTSIYYLIKQDPEKAQQVTMDFTDYLRSNFTAISKGGVVPFMEELEHTKAYLSVEQVRFDGYLYSRFDIGNENFNIPPLTLQPIVENAVKHGVDPELEPLYITVSSRKIKDGNEIIVEDTGIGFGEKDNDDPHIALNNIRQRLDLTCGGKLTISSGESGGTKVVIFVPDREFAVV